MVRDYQLPRRAGELEIDVLPGLRRRRQPRMLGRIPEAEARQEHQRASQPVSKTSCSILESLLNFGCRCLDDVDDEVRDRAAMYLKVYEAPPLVQPYIKEGVAFLVPIPATALTIGP